MVIKDASVSQIKRPIMVNKQALLVKQGGKEGGLKPIVMVEEYKVRLTSIHFYQKTKVRVPLCQVGKSYQSGHKVIDGGFPPSIQNDG